MSWKALDRIKPTYDPAGPPLLSHAVRQKILSFLPRYEVKRAALLPALHVVQDALGHVPHKAMVEIAELLDVHPSDVLDTVSFYTHFWTEPKGRKVIVACRSISCEALGGQNVIDAVKSHLHVGEHGTTRDGEYSFMTEECLAGCDHAPCLIIGEKLHKRVKPDDVPQLLREKDNDRPDSPRSTLFDAPKGDGVETETPEKDGIAAAGKKTSAVQKKRPADATSDVKEMKDS